MNLRAPLSRPVERVLASVESGVLVPSCIILMPRLALLGWLGFRRWVPWDILRMVRNWFFCDLLGRWSSMEMSEVKNVGLKWRSEVGMVTGVIAFD